MMYGGWQDLVWIATVGFEICLFVLVIISGALALRSKVRAVGILLISAGILSILGSGVGTLLQFYFRSTGWSMGDDELRVKLIWAMYGVGVLGHLLEVVGLLLLVIAFRARWGRVNQVAGLGPGAADPAGLPPR